MSDGVELEQIRAGKEIEDFPVSAHRMVYHWSPSDRRGAITEHGLRIRSRSPHSPVRYPMVCLSPDPVDAWEMSGGTFLVDGVDSWDLWGVRAGDLRHGFEVIPYDDGTIRELRVYRSIPARVLHYVASRPSES